jgi:hypothetical protein
MVQIAAIKSANPPVIPNLAKMGKLDKVSLGDGFTRLMVGGTFPTLAKALEHNRKVVKYGQKEAYVIAIYKGQRVAYDFLEQQGVFK